MKQLLIILTIMSFGCSSDQEYMVIDQDFCEQIHLEERPPLAIQLQDLNELMAEKTGVYTLESGDESMISRAYLC